MWLRPPASSVTPSNRPPVLSPQHARLARRIADIIAKADQEKDRAAALRIGCLVLFNALAFQDRLATANDAVPTVREALHQGIPGLRDAWNFICEAD